MFIVIYNNSKGDFMEEKEEIVEVKPQESETPNVEEQVENTQSVNAEKIDRQVINRYIGIDKNLKAVYSTTIFLLVFMALRLVMGLISVGDIGVLFKYNTTQTTVIAVLSIIELVFAIANCALACVYFSFISKLKKGIEKDQDVSSLFAKCKKWTKVISIIFTVFFAFEVGVFGYIIASLGVNGGYLSLLWSALFTFYAWYNLKLLGKLEQDIKSSQND